jgi:hypothetical protein
MTNIELLRQNSPGELAMVMFNLCGKWSICKYCNNEKRGCLGRNEDGTNCFDGVKEWLESESEE